MSHFFQFEQEFVDSLRCIPMQVRYNLDTCGVKLKLAQWNHFSLEERQQLADLPCQTPTEVESYRDFLSQLIRDRTQTTASLLEIDPDPAWLNQESIPETVQVKANEVGRAIAPSEWASLTPLQRFALIKLSRSRHENSNFLPAMQEFHLL